MKALKIKKGERVSTMSGEIEVLSVRASGQYECNVYKFNNETQENEFDYHHILTAHDILSDVNEYDRQCYEYIDFIDEERK